MEHEIGADACWASWGKIGINAVQGNKAESLWLCASGKEQGAGVGG